MGYFSERVKGSVFEKYRTRICWGFAIYAVIAGSALMFSPFGRRFRKAIDEGKWEMEDWELSRRETLRASLLMPTGTREKIEKKVHQKEMEDMERSPRWAGKF